jgi:hypothetical protein
MDNGGNHKWYFTMGSSETNEVSTQVLVRDLPDPVRWHEEWIRMSVAERRAQDNDVWENFEERKKKEKMEKERKKREKEEKKKKKN